DLRAIRSARLQVDGSSAVPDLSSTLLGRGDEQVPFRLRRDDEILLRPPGLGEQDEFYLASLHRFARVRIQVVVPDVSAPVDKRSDFDVALLRAREDFVREGHHSIVLDTAGRCQETGLSV